MTRVVALMVLLVGLAGAFVARAAADVNSFEATASAEGVRVGLAAPNFVLVDQLADAGVPVAQSTVDGLGNSKAFAGNPYPGELVISGPGLLAGLTGLPNPGNYPLHVATSYPTTPEADFSQPSFELAANSAEQSSDAVASAGGSAADSSVGALKATAASRRIPASGQVIAEAVSTADVVNLAGGTLRIGAVRAVAKVTRRPSGPPTRSSSLSVDGMSIGGQSVGFSEKGLVVAGANTPIPEDNPLAQVLEQANISMRYLRAIADPDGIVSPGLMVTQRQQVPQGPMLIVTYVFGRAVAHASIAGADTIAQGALPISGGNGADDSTPPPPTPKAIGVHGAPAIEAASAPVPESRSASAAIASQGPPLPAGAAPRGASTTSIYVILIIGSVLALGGGQLVRIMGVRLAWKS